MSSRDDVVFFRAHRAIAPISDDERRLKVLAGCSRDGRRWWPADFGGAASVYWKPGIQITGLPAPPHPPTCAAGFLP
jgi:hypothetical protein